MMQNLIKKFLRRVGKYAILKEYPSQLGSNKDLDLFIELKDYLRFEKSLKETFTFVKCFYHKEFRQGIKRRYAAYDKGELLIIDLGINAWYERDRRVLSFDEIKDFSNKGVLLPNIVRLANHNYKTRMMTIKHFLTWLKNLVKRVFSNEGMIIAVVGPDGSGKTSVAKELTRRLNKAFNAEYRYMGWGDHTGITRAVYKVYKPVKKKDRLIPYYVELMLRYVGAWLKKRFLGRIIIMDRYFYDKLRSSWYVPRPDITFLLMANPELIRARKDELSLEKINQVYMNYEEVSRILVDANKTVDYSVKQILDDTAISLIVNKVVLE